MLVDIIAFSGKDIVSTVIKITTLSNVSHVGVLVGLDKVIESAVLSDQIGVKVNRLSDRVKSYNGNIWRLHLKDCYKDQVKQFIDYLLAQQGVTYDPIQAVESGLAHWLPFLRSRISENRSRLYCSELVALGLKEARILPNFINASNMRPRDITQLQIFSHFSTLKGTSVPYPFNTRPTYALE